MLAFICDAFICDGCGKSSKDRDDFEERGFIKKCLYCERCLPDIDGYLQEYDDIHTDVSATFGKEIAELRNEYKDFGLPDDDGVR